MTESHTQVILKFDGYVLASREGWQFMLHVVQREREGSHHVLVVFPSLENDRETFAQLIEEASRVTSVQHKQKLISQHETNKSANNEQEEYEEDSFYDGFLDWLDKIFQLAASLGLQETINNKLWEEGNNGNVPNDDVKRIFELMRLIQQLLLGVALMNETSDKVLARLLSNSRFGNLNSFVIYCSLVKLSLGLLSYTFKLFSFLPTKFLLQKLLLL